MICTAIIAHDGTVATEMATVPVPAGTVTVCISMSLHPEEGHDHMTLRPLDTNGNSEPHKSGFSRPDSQKPLLTLRAAVIFALGLVVGVVTGLLTYLASHDLAEAALAGIPACAGAITFLNAVID